MIQLQVLNYILDKQDFSFISLNNLNEEYFSDYENEFKYIKNHVDTYGNVPDKTSFLASFPNFDIIKVSETPEYLLDSLYEDKNTRFLASTFNDIRKLLMENKTEEAMNIFIKTSENINNTKRLDALDVVKNQNRYNEYLEKSNDYNKYYIKTGFKELDNILGGWNRKEELATISARPGIGKSYLLITTAVAAAKQGLNVGIYSGEMSEQAVGYRIDTLISHISNTKLKHGNIEVQNEYKKYLDNLPNIIKGSIKILTPNSIGGPAGVTALRSFIEKENLDMLCVDQHSLLEDDKKAKNTTEKAANISKDLKNLQVMKQIPIIAVSQQNRESTESGVGTEHIAQSDRISQDSSIVLFLENKDGVLTIHLVKSRDSVSNKTLKYAVDWDKGIFTYIPVNEEETSVTSEESEELIQSYTSDYVPSSNYNGEEPF